MEGERERERGVFAFKREERKIGLNGLSEAYVYFRGENLKRCGESGHTLSNSVRDTREKLRVTVVALFHLLVHLLLRPAIERARCQTSDLWRETANSN